MEKRYEFEREGVCRTECVEEVVLRTDVGRGKMAELSGKWANGITKTATSMVGCSSPFLCRKGC